MFASVSVTFEIAFVTLDVQMFMVITLLFWLTVVANADISWATHADLLLMWIWVNHILDVMHSGTYIMRSSGSMTMAVV